jgi:hypothetical protein
MTAKTKLELTWIGKEQRPKLEPRILLEDRELSYHAKHRVTDEDIFDNILIQGDNLLALKALEQEYAGQVKCVYIDPPYNTGSAFEHYDDGVEHSVWLSLMRARLDALWRLLRSDGSLWISIDDSEMPYLRILLDEVCGRQCFVATNVWQKRYSRENREAIGDAHEYVLVYAKDPVRFKETRNKLPLGEKQLSVYKNPNNDPKGPWRAVSLSAQGYRPNQMYEITSPITGKRHRPPAGSCWKIVEPEYRRALDEGRMYFGKDGNAVPSRIQYLKDIEGIVPWTWWPHEEVGHTDESKKEIQALFGKDDAFDTPKPERLVERVPDRSGLRARLPLAVLSPRDRRRKDAPHGRVHRVAPRRGDQPNRVIASQAHLASSKEILTPAVQATIVSQVRSLLPPQQAIAFPTREADALVLAVCEGFVKGSIDIPKITVQATGEVASGYDNFDLDVSSVGQQPVDQEILIRHLDSTREDNVSVVNVGPNEQRLEDYVVRDLLTFPDVDYDSHADLLYKLAGQLVTHLRSYLNDDERVLNVLLYYGRIFADLVHAQLDAHRYERGVTYESKVVEGFTPLRAATFSAVNGEKPRPFREPVPDKSAIRRVVFGGFARCLYDLQKFDSDGERRFAVVLENDKDAVLKWMKPARDAFPIYLRGGGQYEPDFVVETRDARWVCEVKDADVLTDPEVVEKARAAVKWCQVASAHTATTDRKRWRYMLVPDSAIAENMTLGGLAAKFEKRA